MPRYKARLGLVAEAPDGADFAGQFGSADGAIAWNGGELAGHGRALGDVCHLVFQGLDLLLQLEDPFGILADHVADQAGIGAEAGALLPSLNAIGVGGADGRHFE